MIGFIIGFVAGIIAISALVGYVLSSGESMRFGPFK